MKVTMIDPASGWRYGFPKPLPANWREPGFNIKQWCIDQGLPEYLSGYSMRFWEADDESNSN